MDALLALIIYTFGTCYTVHPVTNTILVDPAVGRARIIYYDDMGDHVSYYDPVNSWIVDLVENRHGQGPRTTCVMPGDRGNSGVPTG